MAVFKCKMCGGDLDVADGQTTAECRYCGTQQTLPRLDSDRRANLYDRANHFRRNNEFDKAAGIYEQILADDPDDAEAYWSRVLCRYGIEYVEDPASHKRVPTVNRAQYTSVFDDEDYKAALAKGDGAQQALYRAEAEAINQIQKGILEISSKEEPFDVFVCYKETDASGRRTQDSVLANDLYHQLTQEGFKVFFARITLEDKLGSAYEPYIFAALNSAKVMVVLGTRPEHFQAVWVRNEWSRYLGLIKAGAKKTLIPAYRDMDPYDLPEEFSHLQAQDMSKLGFMQDLIRGIKKIARAGEAAPTQVVQQVVSAGGGETAALLKRAYMFLEDGEWGQATEYCERVLDVDPECAEAYLGELMAELRVRRREGLKDAAEPFDGLDKCVKACRFGDQALRDEVAAANEHIRARNEKARLDGLYAKAGNAMDTADDEAGYLVAAALFDEIADHKDAAAMAKACRVKAEECAEAARAAAFRRAEELEAQGTVESLGYAVKAYRKLGDYNGASARADAAQRKLEELKAAAAAKEAAAAAKRKRMTVIVGVVIAAIVVIALVYTQAIVPAQEAEAQNAKAYEKAEQLLDSGQYKKASDAFAAIEGYRDATERADQAMEEGYAAAEKLLEEKNYSDAGSVFASLGSYKDSESKAEEASKVTNGALFKAIVGDKVLMGSYEQDNNKDNGKEYIEWRVLAKKGKRALVISECGLDVHCFNNDKDKGNKWASSDLKKWLEGSFASSAFSKKELGKIDGKPFCLSFEEAEKYFSSDDDRKCAPTPYAVAQGAYQTNDGACFWWLRSAGGNYDAAVVDSDGRIYSHAYYVADDAIAVRPALWVNL